MKFIILFILLFSFTSAHSAPETFEHEVGSPKDCMVLVKTEDRNNVDPQHELQQKITDCLSPEEEEFKSEAKASQVVSQ